VLSEGRDVMVGRVAIALFAFFVGFLTSHFTSSFVGIASSGYACGYAEAVQWAAYRRVEETTANLCARYRQAAKDRGWFDDRTPEP
jgi:hypothetical protein